MKNLKELDQTTQLYLQESHLNTGESGQTSLLIALTNAPGHKNHSWNMERE